MFTHLFRIALSCLLLSNTSAVLAQVQQDPARDPAPVEKRCGDPYACLEQEAASKWHEAPQWRQPGPTFETIRSRLARLLGQGLRAGSCPGRDRHHQAGAWLYRVTRGDRQADQGAEGEREMHRHGSARPRRQLRPDRSPRRERPGLAQHLERARRAVRDRLHRSHRRTQVRVQDAQVRRPGSRDLLPAHKHRAGVRRTPWEASSFANHRIATGLMMACTAPVIRE